MEDGDHAVMAAAQSAKKLEGPKPKPPIAPLGVNQSAASAEFADVLIAQTAALAGVSEAVTSDRTAAAELHMRALR